MALLLRQTGIQPLGQFDFLDTDQASVAGGEVGEFVELANDGSDKSAPDATDGYVESPDVRTAVRLADAGTPAQPLFILDDGTSASNPDSPGYGTLFGSIIGANTGQATQVSGATVVGPATHVASGKVTCWSQPGALFGTDNHALSAGQLGNPPAPGTALYAQSGSALLGTTSNGAIAAYFVRLASDDSLVSTSFSNLALLDFLKA